MDSFAADKRIRPYVRETPLQLARGLGEASGSRVYLKLENLQETGAFKLRGAANKLLSLSSADAARGIVTASTGN
ncbi:MAG TPA: pyridoxal-phosphate dependent enzyme, partial [Steroidobacteraceae bacterium]|nr:pyridoxal-phosphate dependent enzyme [Steroidobacteraceae bacterium]